MATNIGGQTVTLKYLDPVRSSLVNLRHYKTRPVGIYSGGEITTAIPSNVISIGPLVCEISDGTWQIRAETSTAVSLTTTSVNKYIVLRWTYTGSKTADYIELLAVSSVASNDLLLGTMTYTGPTPTSFSQASRTIPGYYRYTLKVCPTLVPSTRVVVNPGVAATATTVVQVPWQLLDLSGYSTADIVYVYLSDSGTVLHTITSTTYIGKAILAVITIPAGGVIVESSITDGRSIVTKPIFLDGTTLVTNTTTGLTGVASSLAWPGFGAKTNVATDATTLARDVVYQAEVDGFVFVNSHGGGVENYIEAGATSNPTTRVSNGGNWHDAGYADFLFYAPTALEYIRIRGTLTAYGIWFKPIGTGGLVKV